MSKKSTLKIDEELRQQFDFITRTMPSQPDILGDAAVIFASHHGVDESNPHYQLKLCEFVAAYEIYLETGAKRIRFKDIYRRAKEIDREIKTTEKQDKQARQLSLPWSRLTA